MTNNSALNAAATHAANGHSGDFHSPFSIFAVAAMNFNDNEDGETTKFMHP